MSRLRQTPGGWIPAACIALLSFAGCESAAAPNGPQTPPATDPPPIALDWVGVYRGGLAGTLNGNPVNDPAVVLEIRFDAKPDPLCPACVTVRLTDFFERMGLRIVQPVEATFEYWDDTRRHTLSLGKFSTAGGSETYYRGRWQSSIRRGDNRLKFCRPIFWYSEIPRGASPAQRS